MLEQNVFESGERMDAGGRSPLAGQEWVLRVQRTVCTTTRDRRQGIVDFERRRLKVDEYMEDWRTQTT